MPSINQKQRLALIRAVYKAVYGGVESFAVERIGEDLAYLLGAIATNSGCEWERGRPILKVLERELGRKHLVWRFITETKE